MIALFKSHGSSPPARHQCGTTLGTACWTASLLASERIYHAPCAEPVGHPGACLCGRCGAVIAMRRAPVMTMRATEPLEMLPLAAYIVSLVAVAMTMIGAVPLVALVGALWLRFGFGRGRESATPRARR